MRKNCAPSLQFGFGGNSSCADLRITNRRSSGWFMSNERISLIGLASIGTRELLSVRAQTLLQALIPTAYSREWAEICGRLPGQEKTKVCSCSINGLQVLWRD